MLSRLRTIDAIDAPFALGDRVMPPPTAAAVAPKAVADWTRATIADILTDAERGALAEAFPVPKCIARPAVDMHDSAPVENRQRCRIPAAECMVPVDLSSANDAELRAVAERMAAARDWTGWTLHDGTDCPVESNAIVRVRFANGHESESPAHWFRDGFGMNDWRGDFDGRRIVAYRVVPQ